MVPRLHMLAPFMSLTLTVLVIMPRQQEQMSIAKLQYSKQFVSVFAQTCSDHASTKATHRPCAPGHRA